MGFYKDVGILSFSSLIAALISFFSYTLISRYYSIDDFGNFQVFISIANYFILVSCLKYDTAILLDNSKNEKKYISVICIILILLITLVSLLFSYSSYFFGFFTTLDKNIFYIPLFTFFGGLVLLITSINTTNKKFKLIGISKISQNTLLSTSQIYMGIVEAFNYIGLIFGDLLGKFTYVLLSLNLNRIKNILNFNINYDPNIYKKLLVKYKNFPKFSLPSLFINISAFSIPILIINHFYGSEILGYYYFVDRIFAVPALLIGQSISQVYISELSSLKINKPKKLIQNTKNLLIKVSLLVIPIIFLLPFISDLFSIFFGSKWYDAGLYFIIFLPMNFFSLLSSLIGQTLLILEKQKVQFYWDLSRTSIVIFLVFIMAIYGFSIINLLIVFSIFMSLMYIVHLILCLNAIKN